MSKIAEHVDAETRRPNALHGVAVFGYRRQLRLLAPLERYANG